MSAVIPLLEKIAANLPLHRADWSLPLGAADYPQAAVLVLLTTEPEPRVLLGRRALHLKTHPGEIAFAGGKREAQDGSPWDTAEREAHEEVGISADLVRPLGELEPLITRTGFQVFPCVASGPAEPDMVVDIGEFSSVFLPKLSQFADPQLFRLENMSKNGTDLYVPHYQIEQDNVWGVTAAILVQLANVAYDAGFELQRNWKEEP